MNRSVFVVLLGIGSLGVAIAFAQARTRAVFAEDGFRTAGRRAAAMSLLALVLLLTVAVPFSTGLAGAEPDVKNLSLVSLFAVHAILLLFLIGYYVLSGRRSPADFLALSSPRPAADLSVGVLIGALGWVLTVAAAMVGIGVWLALRAKSAAPPAPSEVAPTILWILGRPLWVRILIVITAMVVEELFFRSFLQTRVGPVAATLMFTAAHGVYGQPLFLVGILVISAVLSVTFALYKNVLPCIVAHGTFDAIQMFVVIPLVVKPLTG